MLASKDLAVGRTVCFMDVGGGKLYWAAGCLDEGIAASAANSAPISSAAPVDGDERAARGRASCAATFASYPDVTACLAVTPTGAGGLFTSRIIDRPPLTPAEASKFVGPITLTGDAAHPVLPSFGQGANLALEDAADLAATLAAAYTADTASSSGQPTIAATLRAWEEKRRERTREAQIGSFISGSKSYGEEKLAQAIATSSIPAEDIAAYREKYPTYNAAFSSLLKWRPMTVGCCRVLRKLRKRQSLR
jgi:salicylate hydroxylase